jgi:carbon monoxide dehydrogenase subunit G
MELSNEFRVGVPPAVAWSVLTDVERIAPCLPGAQLQEVEGDEYRGVVKVKVGPITAQYKGKATFLERDEGAGRVVLRAEGRDTRGQGNANATITATLVPDGDGTKVVVVTDLTITGKVAQFGRGVMADVSAKMLTQFVDCVERDVLAAGVIAATDAGATDAAPSDAVATDAAATAPGTSAADGAPDEDGDGPSSPNGRTPQAEATPTPTVRSIDAPPAAPVDLLDAAGVSVAKRVVPLAAVLIFLAGFVRWRHRHRRRRGR